MGTDSQIIFGQNGNAGAMLGEGWAAPDRELVWTDGPSAVLYMPALPVADYAFKLLFGSFAPGARPWQRVRVWLGDALISHFVATGPGEVTLWVPQAAIADAGDPMALRFDVPDCASPADFKLNRDQRRLGIAPRRLTWQALQHGVDPALQAVAWNTESLGRNCEYGVVQRRCEAEPVSLLRWSGMPVSKLIEALTHEFSGLMETAIGQEVPLKAPPNSRRWWLTCERYELTVHTAESVQDVPMEQALLRARARVRLMARKLMEDIRLGERVFVYSNAEFTAPVHAADLITALRGAGGYGPLVIVGGGAAEALRPLGGKVWWARLPRLTEMMAATGADVEGWRGILWQIGEVLPATVVPRGE